MLFREEASRQWQKREAEWERERLARERLMREVLDERQEQIRGKMEELRIQQVSDDEWKDGIDVQPKTDPGPHRSHRQRLYVGISSDVPVVDFS